jgi:hypothetical protein
MKGLQGGIPLAVLAATARAQVQVMGGPGGADVGNHASIPTENTATSTVNEDFKDNHSFELEHEVKVYPPGHDHHKRAAGGPGTSVIGGPSGDDIGNGFAAASVNTFSSEVNEDYKDDHSVDIDKTTIVKPNHHHRRRGDNFPEVPDKPTVIGGPSGDDIGNVADIPTLNEFASSVTESYVDNHSVDVDKNTIVKPHWRRQHSSVIDGPSGKDVGSAAFLTDVNKFSSSFTGKYKDDHSVDIDKTTIVKPGGHSGHNGQEKGEEKGQEYDKGYGQEKGGEKGQEYGKEHGGIGFHHPPNKHEARGDPATVIGGPSGDDIGNVADIPTVNSFTSNFDGHYTDDHSVDVDKTFIVKPHKARALRPGQEHEDGKHGEGVTVVGGPSGDDVGNGFGAANVNTVDTETNESVNDDHSVEVEETEIINPGNDHIHPIKPHSEGYGTEHHSGAQEPAASAPVQHDSHSESDPECTKVDEVVHTVTRTRTAVETATHTVWPQPAHSEGQESSHNQYPPAGSSSSHHDQEQAPAAPQYQSEQDGSKHNYPETGSSSWNSQGSEESEPGHAKGQEQAPAAPQYQSEQDGSKHNYPETGSSSWNSQGSQESGESGHSKGQEQGPATQYGSENEDNNQNYSGSGSSWSDSQAPEQSSNSEYAKGQQQAPAAPQYQEENDSSNSDHEAGSSWSNSQSPAQSSNSQYSGQSATSEQQSHSQDQGQDKSSNEWSSPSASNEEESYNASHAPAASQVYYGAQSSHAAWESTPTSESHGSQDYSHVQYQPSPTSQGAYHAPAASAITVAEASSFSVIPVYVPSGTPWAHAYGSVVVASSSAPVSSAFRVHNPSVPTGASPEQNHRHSPSPSPSTDGVAEFTGGAGRVAKIEGLCGVLVGVLTLLAFAL